MNTPTHKSINSINRKLLTYKDKFSFFFYPVQSQKGSKININKKQLINFASYSYLGLYDHPEIIKNIVDSIETYGAGTQGTRMHGGNLDIYINTEQVIANFLNKDDALLMQSGFTANTTAIQSLSSIFDVVFSAQKNHASIVDGCCTSNIDVILFDHKNIDELKKLALGKYKNSKKIIISDSVFSMDGDIIDLPSLIDLRNKSDNTILIIDDSHGLGTIGSSACGIEDYFHIKKGGVDLLTISLNKVIPGSGGIITGKQDVINYLRYTSRLYYFSSCQSPVVAAGINTAFSILQREGAVRLRKLEENCNFLRNLLKEKGICFRGGKSKITIIDIGNEFKALEISKYCFENGAYILPVAFPAVPHDKEVIRLTITYHHTFDEIKTGVCILKRALEITQAL